MTDQNDDDIDTTVDPGEAASTAAQSLVEGRNPIAAVTHFAETVDALAYGEDTVAAPAVSAPERDPSTGKLVEATSPPLPTPSPAATTADGDGGKKRHLVPLSQMFRFATGYDYVLMTVGAIGGLANGAAMSGFVVILGEVMDSLNSIDPGKAAETSVLFVWLALGVWVAAALQVSCWTAAAERMTIKMREQYLDAILMQEMGFFDKEGTGSLTSKIAENSLLFREAMGEKFGMLFQFFAMFVGGLAVGFTYVWQLCLVIIALSPLIGVSGYIMSKTMAEAVSGQLTSYAKAGNIAEESLRMIRTVTAFNMQQERVQKYENELEAAAKKSTKQGLSSGAGMGSVMFFYFVSYSIAFWAGATFIVESKNSAVENYPLLNSSSVPDFCRVGGSVPPQCSAGVLGLTFDTDADVCGCAFCGCGCYPFNADGTVATTSTCITGGDIILTFFAVLIGSFAIGQSAPSLTALASGRAAAKMLYDVIDRKPEIDASSTEGQVLTTCRGELKFENVSFQYPTRNQVILKQLNMVIPAGQRVALVGESGSGKSTIIQLLERYYDPFEGALYLDGIPYKDINLSSLRKLIGLVSQEPVLFATSVMENVRYGRPSATDEEVIEACKQANADNFIRTFAEVDPYQTFVTSSLVSGGQKQRLAIARALLRNPPILMLDEATAALDNESERLVNEAIDKLLLVSRTTIVIAHRLSSIQTCDKIFVLDYGVVVEEGSPAELAVLENGHYAAMLKLSNGAPAKHLLSASPAVDAKAVEEEDVEQQLAAGPSAPAKPVADKLSVAPLPSQDVVDIKEETKDDKKKKKGKKTKGDIQRHSLFKAFRYSKPDRLYFIPALTASALNGLSFPVFALLFSYVLQTLYLPNNAALLDGARVWCLAFFGLAAGTGLAVFFQNLFFGFINGRTTMRARKETFRHVLSMEIGYFDLKENNVGALTTRLGADCGTLKSALSDRMEVGSMNLSTIVAGLVIAMIGSWQVALVTFCLFPAMVMAGAFQILVMSGIAGSDQKALAEAAHTLTESIGGIRTVAAFEMQGAISKLYMKQLTGPLKKAVQKGLIAGVGFGFSQAIMFFCYALAFWYGSTLVTAGTITFQGLNQALFGILMTAMAMGQTIAMFPDIGKGQAAVNSIFSALDRKSKIDPFSLEGQKPSVVVGDISFENIDFAYPSRPEVTVLDNFNLEVKRGQTVAFVGTSGSGKSTLVLLLERFYDPLGTNSSVKVDGVDVRDLNLEWLRSQIGIVSQEPSLFQGTISDNIRNGKMDATEDEVVEAAKMANCHDFIMKFPNAYQTEILQNSLSGGQKQRVCIARALLRQPKILLLDEATSALDEESQRVVQQALDRLLETSNRTTIVVAHRLSTIRNADVIVVLQHGVVVEQGSFEELSTKPNGSFQALLRAQQQQE
ncbi:hypothetical protein BASA81_008743 [Batrachochytrium salamandrivorans]|nr:hypothetical protein BASA81_008743 [Batrachochytrium salamandrivorans]